jgi:hypothetical protein
VLVGGRRSKRPGPSPTLGSLGPSYQWCHKSWVSLRGPPCAHGVAGTPYGEVHDMQPTVAYHAQPMEGEGHSPGSSIQKLVHFLPFIKRFRYFSYHSEATERQFFFSIRFRD